MRNDNVLVRNNLKRKPLVVIEDSTYIICDKNEIKRALTNLGRYGAMAISADKHGKDWDDLSSVSRQKADETRQRNLRETRNLKEDLKKMGLGYVPAWGGYYNKKTGESDANERSFFVTYSPNLYTEEEFFNKAIELCNKYDQDAVLVCLPRLTGGKPKYFDKNGNESLSFDEIRESTDEDEYYTDLQKKKGGEKTQKFSAVETKDSAPRTSVIFIKQYPGSFATNCIASSEGEDPFYDKILKIKPMDIE